MTEATNMLRNLADLQAARLSAAGLANEWDHRFDRWALDEDSSLICDAGIQLGIKFALTFLDLEGKALGEAYGWHVAATEERFPDLERLKELAVDEDAADTIKGILEDWRAAQLDKQVILRDGN